MEGVVWEVEKFFLSIPVVVNFVAGVFILARVGICKREDSSATGMQPVAWGFLSCARQLGATGN